MAKKASIKLLTTELLKELRGGADAPAKGAKAAKDDKKKGAKALTKEDVKKIDGGTAQETKVKTSDKFVFTCNTHCYDPNKTKATE